jgi:SET domain-containing protein
VDGEERVGIFATRDVLCGEEFCYDYKFEGTGVRQVCVCGSSNCSGFVGGEGAKKEAVKRGRQPVST